LPAGDAETLGKEKTPMSHLKTVAISAVIAFAVLAITTRVASLRSLSGL
jgi:hypothetical protein